MKKNEIKKELNQFTKEQIINVLSDICSNNYYSSIILRIINILNDELFKSENNLIDKAEKEWEKASQEHNDYVKQLKEKYGKEVNVIDLTFEEHNKWLELYNKDNETYRKLEKLQNEQSNRLNKKVGGK